MTKSSLDNTTTSKMAGLVKGITNQARSVVRDLDPINELAFLRLRSTKTEFLIAPGNANVKGLCVNDLRVRKQFLSMMCLFSDKDYVLVVLQTPPSE